MTQEYLDLLATDANELIKFIVKNNFVAVRRNLLAAKFPVAASENEAAAIVTIQNLYNSGYAVNDLLNVNYINTASNGTGGVFDNTANKINWNQVGTTIGEVLLGVLGGAGAGILGNVLGNQNNLPPATPQAIVVEDKTPMYLLFGALVLFIGVGVYGATKKNNKILFAGLIMAAVSIGAYFYFTDKKRV